MAKLRHDNMLKSIKKLINYYSNFNHSFVIKIFRISCIDVFLSVNLLLKSYLPAKVQFRPTGCVARARTAFYNAVKKLKINKNYRSYFRVVRRSDPQSISRGACGMTRGPHNNSFLYTRVKKYYLFYHKL